MSGDVKFTVIVPTRERPDTLIHCLRTLVAQDYDNAEFIVSDNFSQDNTKEIVESFDDPRIRYINTGKRISMSHNWEFALGQVTDGWVTILGDDDGMLPGGLAKVAQVVNESGCKAVTSKWSHYCWPNSNDRENQLTIPLVSGVELRVASQWLDKVMRGHAQYYELPWLYVGGFVEIGLINAARDEYGRFFMSMTPDVYSSIALALVTDRYVFMNETVCIVGASSHSTGAAAFGASNNQKASQKFYSEENIPLHSNLGSKILTSIPFLIYECYLQAAHLHTDSLVVDMSDQLALARSHALPRYYEEVRNGCDEIACLNGVDIWQVEKKEKLLRLGIWYRKFSLQNIRKLWQLMVVNAKDFGVEDVYSAAVLANVLYVFRSKYRNWRWCKLASILNKFRT